MRRRVGYDRFSSKAAYAQLEQLYQLTRLQTNFFQPICKLVAKERVGAKVRKRYDRAQTPYPQGPSDQRLLMAGVLDAAQQRSLAELYQSLNPVELRAQIDEVLEALWKLAQRDPVAKQMAAAAAKVAEMALD